MRKWLLIIGVAIGVPALIIFLVQRNFPSKTKSQDTENSKNEITAEVAGDKSYADPAGFQFDYPGDLIITPQKTKDDEYANVFLRSRKKKGEIHIYIKDTTAATLDQYLKQNKITSTATNSAQITLDDLEGKTISTTTGVKTIVVDSNIVYILEVATREDKNMWMDTYQKVLASFKFSEEQSSEDTTSAPADTSSEEYSDVEEEIVE